MQCRKCPLNLRCLAGRLGHVCFCPHCGYLTLEDVDLTTVNGRVRAVRLRCERRTKDVTKGLPPMVKGQGVIVADPVGGFMGVAQCSKCEAEDRRAQGWTSADPDKFTAVELD